MKSERTIVRSVVLALALVGLLAFGLAGTASAAPVPLYFDSAGTTWDGTTWDDGITSNWGAAPGGPYNKPWAGGNDAHFEGTGGAVAVSGTILSVNSITFDTPGYSIGGGSIGFVNTTSTLTATANAAGTISANFAGVGTAGNKIAKLGSAKLTLAGNTVLVLDNNGNMSAGFTVDGGGELEITGALKAASTLQSNRSNFTNTVGATTANNTLTISGVGGSSVYGGGMTIGGSTFGGNSVVISRPGTQLTPSYKMAGNGAQLNLGVSSSNNRLTVSNGAYLYTTQGGGTMTWTIGTNAGANNNSILITDPGSTIDRTGGSGAFINVGAAGDNNSITISAGGKLRPRRFAISTNGGDNNYTLVTGSGSTLDNNESNSRLTVASAAGSVNNRLVVENGGFANFINGSAAQCSVGSVNGADNNYIRVDGINVDTTKSSFVLKNPNPLTIGGVITTTPFVDSLASGNHLDVWNGATTSQNSVYVMGVGSAFNLGNGTAVSTPSEATVAASTGNAAYAAGITLYNADSRLNIDNGRLIAGVAGKLVSGLGNVNLLGPAYVSTAFTNSIDVVIYGDGSLTKEGIGTLSLSQANTYGGGTIVNGGALGGTGTISGLITVNAGGKIAPGNSIGQLNGANLTWNSDDAQAGMSFELSATDNTCDVLNLSGAFTKGAGSSFLFDFTGGMTGMTYTLVKFSSSPGFSVSDFAIGSGLVGLGGKFKLTANTLEITVPEPATLSLLVLGGLAVIGRRRRVA